MRAADLIVQSLKAHGVKRIYCVPGESYLALLDALHGSGIDVIVCRHEGGAGFAACAESKLTGKPAVVMVSRGPGATNVSIAVHMANQDALPLILIVGQVSREERTRKVFQEVDYQQFFGHMTKGVFEVQQAEKLHELLPRGLRLAREGVPGPVVFSLPEDVLHDDVTAREPLVFPLAKLSYAAKDIAPIQDMIDRAERPLLIAGSALRSVEGKAALKRFAEAQRIPVALTWKSQDLFDNSSSLYAGHLGFGAVAAHKTVLYGADLILAVGTRLGDIASVNYTLPEAPAPTQTLVHVYPHGDPIGLNHRTDYGLIADPAKVLADLAAEAQVVSSAREAWVSKVNGVIKDMQVFKPVNPDDGVDFGEVVMAASRQAPKNAVLVMDSGNAGTWMHRHWLMTPENIFVGAIVGAMGLAVPATVAAGLEHPERMTIAVLGDGAMLMTGQELATAMAHGLKPKILLSDNGSYGTIRLHQERSYPARVSGTGLVNPDFTAWAKSFGADAFTLRLGDDVEAVVKAFLASDKAAVLHVHSSLKALSANAQMPK